MSLDVGSLHTSSTTVAGQCDYDSDFSEASTIPSSESEDEAPFPTSKVPEFCRYPPEIPNGRFVWNCSGCDYDIDFLNLSPDILNHLPNDAKRVFDSETWTIKDEAVQLVFFQLVSDHYTVHHLPADLRAAIYKH